LAVLIDTSILVASERGALRLEQVIHPDEQYAISVVSAAELLHGVHRAGGRRAQGRSAFVEGLLAAFASLPVDMPTARAYARLSASLARTGTSVNANDLWIGATAVALDLKVLALDGDFDRIPGLNRVPLG
jgi:tRNA(fMet)-specific endonuclease VapC